MAECVVLNIGEGATGMEDGMVRCGSWGMERQWMVSECKLCEVLVRNVALEEVKQFCWHRRDNRY